jgi:hypothetical protein
MENPTKPVSTISVGVKYGLISAIIFVVFFIVIATMGLNVFDNKWGWFRIPVSIILMVLAHKNFKDQGDGFMSYGQGFGVGFWMSLVSLVVGGIFTFVYVKFVDAGAMDMMMNEQRDKMTEKHMSEEQIEMAITWTKKLFWPIFVVFGLLFGVVTALIVSIFTQKKNPTPAF